MKKQLIEKQKIALDTNVIFKILNINYEYQKDNIKGINRYKKKNSKINKRVYSLINKNIKQTFSQIKQIPELSNHVKQYNEINKAIKKSHNKKEKNYLFEKLCELHKSLDGAIGGKLKEYTKNIVHIKDLEEKLKIAKQNNDINKIREYTGQINYNNEKNASLAKFQKFFTKNKIVTSDMFVNFDNFVEKYKDTKQNLYTAKLFEDSANGKVELCVPTFVFKEIKNHYREGSHIDSRTGQPIADKHLVSKVDVESFLSRCTLLTYSDKTVQNIIDEFSQGLIKESKILKNNKKEKPYLGEKNSLDEYGDLLIVAMCNIAGIPIVSHNEKHLVGDDFTGIEKLHTIVPNKRNYLKLLCKYGFGKQVDGIDISEYASNAYPYTFGEYDNKDIDFNINVSKNIQVKDLSKADALELGFKDAKYFDKVTVIESNQSKTQQNSLTR